MQRKVKVRDYMTQDVVTVSADDPIEAVVRMIHVTGHDGFPVVDDDKVCGYISARDILTRRTRALARDAMVKDVLVATADMDIQDAARVMFRSGLSKLPVVDKSGDIVGIITNSDVIRSQIERADPEKVWQLKRTLETIHDLSLAVKRDSVVVEDLMPTQPKIYADELEGREYELKKGLAEPVVVVRKPDKTLLVDGHHRAVAAQRLGIEEMDAYIIVLEEDVPLGMERTARDAGLKTLDDIRIMDYAKHPLIEVTQGLLRGGNGK